jgi:hypothetical protein
MQTAPTHLRFGIRKCHEEESHGDDKVLDTGGIGVSDIVGHNDTRYISDIAATAAPPATGNATTSATLKRH